MKFIDCYNHRAGWSRVEDPFGEYEDFSQALVKAGFTEFETIGGDSSTKLQIYQSEGDETWLVVLDTFNSWIPFITTDGFPSVLMLLKELSTWFTMAKETRFLEVIEEFQELLMGYRRTVGPLAECLLEHRAQLRHDANERKQAEQKRAEKLKHSEVPE